MGPNRRGLEREEAQARAAQRRKEEEERRAVAEAARLHRPRSRVDHDALAD